MDWPDAIPVQVDSRSRTSWWGAPSSTQWPAASRFWIAYLAAPGSGIGLTVKIPEGMRATSVKSDEVVGVAGFLFPGSHVDVLVTFRSDRVATPVTATQIVLQDVEVLTTGQNFEPDPQGKAQSPMW